MQLLKILFLVQVTAIGSSEYYNFKVFKCVNIFLGNDEYNEFYSLKLLAWKDILLGCRKLRSEKTCINSIIDQSYSLMIYCIFQ